ncbi:hypothetical protein H7K45_25305 [Mycobacterium yunnanensis]|uniref:Uncharacterized protein n=1 Tax=Mycobacterium yunnanensis TaxID=368477 RepID=A0A9X3C409_9MYCO|nr:hypothetical protein [Mycobacterium yunnanensis]MCV7423876.1 hypothetical protein [Mycobacterium yunnanensis]
MTTHDVEDLARRIAAELTTMQPGTPVSVTSLSAQMRCSTDDVLAAGALLEHRNQGDDQLFTVVRRSEGGAEESFVSRVPVALNDEPDTR